MSEKPPQITSRDFWTWKTILVIGLIVVATAATQGGETVAPGVITGQVVGAIIAVAFGKFGIWQYRQNRSNDADATDKSTE